MARDVIRISVRHISGTVPKPNFRAALNRAREEMETLVLADAKRRAGDAVRSGEYMKSINTIPFGWEGFILQSDVEHAWYLEYGTGLYGPKKRAYEINPRREREIANFAEYLIGKARRQADGVWPEGFRKTPHSYLKWYEGGSPVFAMQVIAPGMRPEPNLGPAIFENIDAMEAIIVGEIVDEWND